MPLNPGDFYTGLDKMRKTIKDLPVQLGAQAENFFRDNFRVQGWQGDNGIEPWAKRKSDASTRWILVGKGTAHLMKGLRKFVSGNNIGVKVTGVATAYADIHNFGGTVQIPVSTKMRKWAWAMFYHTGRDMYKGIALTKKSSISIHMPKRQFIGNSKMLDAKLYELIEKKLNATQV